MAEPLRNDHALKPESRLHDGKGSRNNGIEARTFQRRIFALRFAATGPFFRGFWKSDSAFIRPWTIARERLWPQRASDLLPAIRGR
jgi:hypothetical protein